MIRDEIVVFPAHEYNQIARCAGSADRVKNFGFVAVHKSVSAHAVTSEEAVKKCYNQSVRSDSGRVLA